MKNLISFLFTLCCIISCSSKDDSIDISSYPQLISSTPTNNASDISYQLSSIVLTFDEAVYADKSATSNITFGATIDEISSFGIELTVKVSLLEPGQNYTLTFPEGTLYDSDHNYLPSLSISFSTATPVTDIPGDKTGVSKEAKELIREIGVGWNLGNALESYYDSCPTDQTETSWGNPATTEDMILAVKAAGFNAIRIPVRWYPHCDSKMNIDNDWLARVKQVVDYCINNDLYVILNTHHELWLENYALYADSASIHQKENALWRNIATAFRDYDEHLIFSGTNEVHITDNWNAPTTENATVQNCFNQWFVNAVRSTGGRNMYRNLIVQVYAANPEYGLAHFSFPSDIVRNRIMVEFHYYSPYDYAGDCSIYYWGIPYKDLGISSFGQEKDVEALFSRIKAAWSDKGYPVIMGEYGVASHYDTEANKTLQAECRGYYMKTITSLARKYGFAPFVWDNNAFGNGKEMFGIFDRNNNMNINESEVLNGIMEGRLTVYP